MAASQNYYGYGDTGIFADDYAKVSVTGSPYGYRIGGNGGILTAATAAS